MKKRVLELYQMLSRRHKPLSLEQITRELEISKRTALRYIKELRTQHQAPIESVRGLGYVCKRKSESLELSGQWFFTAELEILLLLHVFMSRMAPSTLESSLHPFIETIKNRLRKSKPNRTFPVERVRILMSHKRTLPDGVLQSVVSALSDTKRIRIQYNSRSSRTPSQRTLSIQRLVYYRDHWYIDAWDHSRNDLRTFSLDRIKELERTSESAIQLEDEKLDLTFRVGYGIFAGSVKGKAKLRFSKEIAPWVATERWHTLQESSFDKGGSYLLEVPYSNTPELVGEILRYGPDVEVLGPPELRTEVQKRLTQAASLYT